jgi:hypothetical protein
MRLPRSSMSVAHVNRVVESADPSGPRLADAVAVPLVPESAVEEAKASIIRF